MEFKRTQDIMDFMLNFNKLFDIIRIVDPVSKEVLQYNGIVDSSSAICYEYWKNGTHCPNCVSSRAMNENDTFVKVEYNREKIYMVMASPTKLGDKNCIVELLKDITENSIIPDLNGKTMEEINDIIIQLNQELIIDELTRVFNRRYINERLPADIFDAFKNNNKLSVIMLDIDYFKKINDTYGHDAGDVILKEVCVIIKSKIRKEYDWVARYGGEEFLITLPGADSKTAYRVAEEIREIIDKNVTEYEGQKIHVTISAGICTMDSENIILEDLFKRVDKKMYEAKSKGRNIVV